MAKNIAGKRFYNFFVFFTIFFGIFWPGLSMNGIRDLNFVFFFSADLIPFWLKIWLGRGFIIFSIFYYLFRNFLARVEYERNSGLKFCFHFFGLSHPVLAKNKSGKGFYSFLNFFSYFFRNFLVRVEYEQNSGLKFCFHFFGLSDPVLAKNNAGKRFYNFLNFFTIFCGIFLPGSRMNEIRD